MTFLDLDLCCELNLFHCQKMLDLHEHAFLNNMGSDIIMGDAILFQIMDYAHAYKIDSLQLLHYKTKWNWSSELGKEVLDIVY